MKRFLIFGLLVFSLIISPQTSKAQVAPVKQWDKTFGGDSQDELLSLRQTSDGGYILGGISNSGILGDKTQINQGLQDYWIVKVDANGNKQWDKTFGGSAEDYLSDLIQTPDGGYLLGGYSNSGISLDKSQASKGDLDYWIVKLDAIGNKLWDKTIGGNSVDKLFSLALTNDGGYILGGFTGSSPSGDQSQPLIGGPDYWIVKLDAAGNKIWDKIYGGSNADWLNSLTQTTDGGFILGGYSFSGISGDKTQPSLGYNDYWVVKVDASGNKLWDRTIGGSGSDELISLAQTIDGGYILGGISNSGTSGNKSQASKGGNDYWIMKLSSSGALLWEKSFGGSADDHLLSIAQTQDGGIILGGDSRSYISADKSQDPIGDYDYWILKLDANGNRLWDKTIGGNSTDYFRNLRQTTDGGFVLGGYSYSVVYGDKSQGSWGSTDYWIVKLGPEVLGLKEGKPEINISISPNPNQGKFQLQISNLKNAKAEVTITDLLGRKILHQELKAANNQINQELTIPATKGMYLLQVKSGEQVSTRKIVVE
ncbi:T9SS type A sorting domain-containing protein [Adhaeribacter soli]|uniref:T9SS type A sorting domain-containing protein n=1 Tax=Adhaeribacter soli TaxID=2607655 RepID=A0A5N1IS08_9BACT|nr:T9SS type A sorting domain-containing protein [Adhaeribacter soli]KAA9332701.1 T9SS type A sorting domain-containing protein [Adhaeribacter soli]